MKTQINTTLTYIAPKIKTVSVSIRSHILQGSPVNQWRGGSHTEGDIIMVSGENEGW